MATTTPSKPSAAEAEVERLLGAGQWFLAFDAAKAALAVEPASVRLRHYAARALLSLGAAEEAGKILAPLSPAAMPDDAAAAAMVEQATAALGQLLAARKGGADLAQSLAAFYAVADALGKVADVRGLGGASAAADEETLGLLGRVYKDLWRESGRASDARRCRDAYLRGHRLTGGAWTGINAATMSHVVARDESAAGNAGAAAESAALARELAARVAELSERKAAAAAGVDRFWALATLGEALLHLGRGDEAAAAYARAAALPELRPWLVVSASNQLDLLERCGVAVPARVRESLRPPVVAVFAGHMIDAPGRATPRFPPGAEADVRRRIEACLDELSVGIGYSAAACGGDLLFVEAMNDRDAEVNLVLPYAADDFERTSVAFAGPAWVRRFRRAVKLAGENVTYSTAERYLGSASLLRYANDVLQGLAYLRARSMGTRPFLIAAYDGSSAAAEGGTADAMSRWPDPSRLRVIPVGPAASTGASGPPAPVGASVAPPPPPPARPAEGATQVSQLQMQDIVPAAASSPALPRVIRTMLFADVVGFSKLDERQVPFYMQTFLAQVATSLRQVPRQPLLVNTWGDAIFAVMDGALAAVDYARALQRAVCGTDWSTLGLPAGMSARIGLHAGPVYEGVDAITGRPNVFGSHVNRAARIEPVTLPGHVYASGPFVALLTCEQQRAGGGGGGPDGGWPFVCDYLGRLALAKDFGVMPVYSVRTRFGGDR